MTALSKCPECGFPLALEWNKGRDLYVCDHCKSTFDFQGEPMGKKEEKPDAVPFTITCRCGIVTQLTNPETMTFNCPTCGRAIAVIESEQKPGEFLVKIGKKTDAKPEAKTATADDAIVSAPHKEPETGTAPMPLGETGELPLDDKKGKPVEPKTAFDAHDRDLLARSINDRIETLTALAKKNKDEGYVKEAAALERDAEILRSDCLPHYLSTTLPLPFTAASEARAQLKKVVRVRLTETARLILGIVDWLPNKQQTAILAEASNTMTLDLLGILLKVTNEARAQGALDRTIDPAAIVEKAVRGAFESVPK